MSRFNFKRRWDFNSGNKLVTRDDIDDQSSVLAAMQAELASVYATREDYAARPRLVQAFAAGDNRVGVERKNDDYFLFQGLGDGRFLRTGLERTAGLPGGFLSNQIRSVLVVTPGLSVEDDAAGVVRTGTGWSTAVANASAYGGDYSRSNVAGDKITWTTPADVTRVGIRTVQTSNAGIAVVAIDGDKTRATNLPTAQDYVDNGVIPGTALVSGGGTLNPTDRLLDGYFSGTNWDVLTCFADDLSPAVHTVELTVTAYKQASATDTRTYVGGWTYALPQTTIETSGAEWVRSAVVLEGANSAFEYAYSVTPSGASSSVFVGCVHGYEVQDAPLTLELDGETLTLASGGRAWGKTAKVTRTARLRHPETGETDLGTVDTSYLLDVGGLEVRHTTTWATGGLASAIYPAMFPVNGAWLRGVVDGLPAALTLTGNDGLYKGRIKSRAAAVWQRNGKYAACLFLPDPEVTVAGWANSGGGASGPSFMSIEDRYSNGTHIHKVYVTRIGGGGTTKTYAAGEVWNSRFQLRVARFAAGPDTLLPTLL